MSYKEKQYLDAASRINDMIIRDMLGIKTSSSVFTTTAQKEPKSLNEEKLISIINQLHSDEIEEQKRLIKLMASVGFKVQCGLGFEEATVFLPTKYEQAIFEVVQDQRKNPKTRRGE